MATKTTAKKPTPKKKTGPRQAEAPETASTPHRFRLTLADGEREVTAVEVLVTYAGALVAFDDDGSALAIYAPGGWRSVEQLDTEQPTE